MFSRIYLILFFLVTSFFAFGQLKKISLQQIWDRSFETESIDAIHSMKSGQQYSVINFNAATRSTSIDLYEYKSQLKIKSVIDSKDLEEIDYFTDYAFNNDESKVLLLTNPNPVYRRSILGTYFIYDISSGDIQKVWNYQIQEPTFSPDGLHLAFSYENNIYVKNLETDIVKRITGGGEKNKIINGITDWVYEEEFAFVRAYEWNIDGTKIAYIRFDESEVPEFSMDVYGDYLYQKQQVFKYPKAGEKNSVVSLHIYDLDNGVSKTVKLTDSYEDFYIPRIKWTLDPSILSAQYINRHQNQLDLWFINSETDESKLVLRETDDAYIDITDVLTFLKDNSFIWTSEKDGFNHIYHYSKEGNLINKVTAGNWDVTAYYGYDEKRNKIFYQSVENSSIEREIFSISLNGKNKLRLSDKIGTNDAFFSSNFSYYINSFSSSKIPPFYTLNNASNGKELKVIKTNENLLKKLKSYQLSEKIFSTIQVNGNELNMWTLKPVNFDPLKKYPLLMFQYSGPGSQEVSNSWNSSNDYWHLMLAQMGYFVVCVDGRGTGFKGADFKKLTYLNLVKYETEDQIAVAEKLSKLPHIDESRIGIWGWSFGGHMSTNCLLKGSSIFKMAIAVAPVTNWRFYDTIYTERYMRTPQENPNGYDDNSPFFYPQKLRGDYLLIHGSADDNVHLQHTMRMVEALVQAGKEFEWAIYPDKNHGIYGGNTRLHLYQKMTNFLSQTLGDKISYK